MTIWYARNDVPYSGGDKFISITFPYIKKEYNHIYINDVETENYTYLNETQIEVYDELNIGDVISVRRSTPIDEKVVVFSNTTILDANTQNLAQDQVFSAVQEMHDSNTHFKNEVENTNKQVKNELVETANQLYNQLGEQVATTEANFLAITESNKQEIIDLQGAFQTEITTTVNTNKNETDKQIKDFKSSVTSDISQFKTDVNTDISQFKTDVNTDISSFKTTTNTSISDFKTATNTSINDFKTTTNTSISDFKTATNTSISDFKTATNQTINEFETTTNTSISEFETTTNQTINDFKTKINNDISTFTSTTDDKVLTIEGKVNSTLSAAQSAQSNSENAVQTANSADTKAQNAIDTANNADTNANTATTIANEAKTTAQNAIDIANNASEVATTAKDTVNSFGEDIQVVISAADQITKLEESVATAVSASEAASIAANEATIAATEATTAVNNAEEAVENAIAATTRVENALSSKADTSDLTSHTGNKSNPHAVTKTQIGLGNVDNTSDANKPVSTATQTALDGKANTSDLTSHTGNKSNPHAVTKAQVGLGNVDNTSDANKPISTATQAALNNKLAINGTADKALKDSNGLQISTNYMRRTIGDASIPATPTAPTALAMVGRQGCGNGNIAGGNLVALHKNTLFRCYERGSTITCNYDDKVANLGKTMCNGTFDGHYTQINPSTSFTSKPFVWQVTSPTQYEVSDVCRLHIYSHRLLDALNVTAFKIEAYIQDTLTNSKKWVTAYEYSGASKNIAQTGFGLYKTGYSSNTYYSIFGIRLTISGSPDTTFRMSEIQLVASRGTETLADSLQCISNAGGKVWGNLEVTGNITSSNTYTKTEVDTKIANSTGTGDGKTITKTSDNKLQAVGVLDARNTSTALKTWTGTRAQYDAITTKNANTIYNITDDTDVTLTLLNTLYPVGAIYIGTCASCPLQVLGVGNWALKASDMVLQGSGTRAAKETVEAGLPNIEGTGFVIDTSEKFSGALYKDNTFSGSTDVGQWNGSRYGWSFDASLSNPIYGNSDTVQPPAYIVNIWERIS